MAKDVSPLARKDLPRSPMQTRDEARASRSVFESRAPPRSPLKRSDDATPKSPSRSPMDTSGRPRKSQLPLVLKRDVGGSSANVGPKRKGETDNVRVMVRVRPFGQSEIDAATEEQTYMQSVINMPRHDQVAFLDHAKDYESKQGFNFDSVFWSCTQEKNERVPFSGQQEVYLATGRPALETAWEGINSCIFAYGQTGSGKTHTMMGDPSKITAEGVLDEDSLGLIPRLCRDLFRDIDTWEENAMSTGLTKKSEVEVRFLEIYNEKVKDLLMNARMPDGTRGFQQHLGEYENSKMTEVVDGEDLKVREHPSRGPYVHGATAFKPRSYDDIMSLLAQGNAARHIASTNMNDRSSRSHAMFRVRLWPSTPPFSSRHRTQTNTHNNRSQSPRPPFSVRNVWALVHPRRYVLSSQPPLPHADPSLCSRFTIFYPQKRTKQLMQRFLTSRFRPADHQRPEGQHQPRGPCRQREREAQRCHRRHASRGAENQPVADDAAPRH